MIYMKNETFSIKTQKEIASSIESQKVTLFMDLKIQQGINSFTSLKEVQGKKMSPKVLCANVLMKVQNSEKTH